MSENKTNQLDFAAIDSISQMWPQLAKEYKDIVALQDPHSKPEIKLTYSQVYEKIQQFASGLQVLGIEPQTKIALIADDSYRWAIADQGIMTAGAVNAVRSSGAERQELLYIIEHSDSSALVVQDRKTLDKLKPELDDLPIKLIILLSDEESDPNTTVKTLNFEAILALGAENPFTPVSHSKDDLATLLYTSGTTGKPKGVMLTNANLVHQIRALPAAVINPPPGDRILTILPTWHVLGRTGQYLFLSKGCTQIYTGIRYFKSDLKKYQPNYMIGVPRLLESIYEGVQKQFREQPESKQKLAKFFLDTSEKYIIAKRTASGTNLDNLKPSAIEKLKAILTATLLTPLHLIGDRLVYQKIRSAIGPQLKMLFCGGGSLSRHLDNFYEIIGITILVGYGLSETAPVTNARRPEHNIRGTSGPPIPHTTIKIVDQNTRQALPNGQRGIVLIRGPQVMQGYYKNPEATAKAIDPEGWFDSGDIGFTIDKGDLVLTGRAKDTIVLTNGENIEPQPIEDACARSQYVDQIMLVGQDRRSLGALIVPNTDALEKWAKEENIPFTLPSPEASREDIKNSDLYSKAVVNLFRQELKTQVQNRPGYRADDIIGSFEFILTPFSPENGLMTQTLKIKRPIVTERYRDIIDGMFEK
ncbi:MAG: AMP-dependent synthetase/ligase [Prochloraceae cyanobacterium]